MNSTENSPHLFLSSLNEKELKRQVELITHASEAAQSRIDYQTAHDDHILRAVEVVEEFLRKKHRLCYGGQAINAHLPDSHKFYDPNYSIPDYDFFTPNPELDISMIVNDLKKAGFNEISAREGMHEGTVKIYVEYVPVADVTTMDPKLYRILSHREYKNNGISYLDSNTLRMLMYLELSRPRGQVTRWPKIYERLMLFNEYVERPPCRIASEPFSGTMTKEQVEFTLRYVIEKKRIFAGGDLISFYQSAMKRGSKYLDWILKSKKPLIFYSPDPSTDVKALQNEFNFLVKQDAIQYGESKKLRLYTIRSHDSKGVDVIPTMKILGRGSDQASVFIIHETACHSYINLPMKEGLLRVASIDTLITLYFSMGLMKSAYFDMGSLECMANQLVELSIHARKRKNQFIFPFVSIVCSGHQSSLPSLIRAKVKRMMTKKKKIRNLLQTDKTTVKQLSLRNQTVKQSLKPTPKPKKKSALSRVEQALLQI